MKTNNLEIHILLEGEQVGPLTEAQVRQYLSDGLVTGDDLASCEGMADWMPLEQVLAKLVPLAPPTATGSATKTASSSPGQVEAPPEVGETPFVIHKDDEGEMSEPPSPPLRQKTASLTSSQRTKRKLNKIVIQPILPLETTPAKKKPKTGKALLSLEALRPTTALPPVMGHQPREKRAARGVIQTGQLSFADFAEKPAPEPVPIAREPVAPPPATPPDPVHAPAPAEPVLAVALAEPVPPTTLPEPAHPTALVESASTSKPVELVQAIVTAEPVRPAAATEPSAPAVSATPSSPVPAPVTVDVLPPPVERLSAHWKKPEGRRSNAVLFPRLPAWALVGGLALLLLIVCGIIAWVYFLVAHEQPVAIAHPATSADTDSGPAPNAIPAPAEPATASDFSDRGLKRQANGDFDGALADYDRALSLDPKAVEVFYRRGLAHQAKGDLAGAIADYTQVIALNPQRANAFSNRAFIKQSQGDLDGALADYAHALLINPNIAEAYNNMGLINVKRGDIDGAIAAYNRALTVNPKMAFAFYNRGVAKNMEGNVDGAIADYTQALALQPNIARAYCDRGTARQSKGDKSGALADYSQALALNPAMPDAFASRGLIKLQQGDLAGAAADNAQALALDPKDAPAYHHRGLALFGLGKLDDALVDLKQFCALVPRDPATDTARLYIWVISTHQSQGGDADAQLSTALLNDWNSPPEDLTSKIASFLLGHISETDLIANAASPDPSREPGQYCRVWYFAGMKRLLGGDATKAVGYFQKSVATAQKDYCEYTFAQAELQSLGKNPEVAAKPESGT